MRVDIPSYDGEDKNGPITAEQHADSAMQRPRARPGGPPGLSSFVRPSQASDVDESAPSADGSATNTYVIEHLARLMRDGRVFYVGDRKLTLGRRGMPQLGEEELSVARDGLLMLSGKPVELRNTPAARRDETAHLALHGQILKDPYQWMDEGDPIDNAELVRWMNGQNDYTRLRLDRSNARPLLEQDMRDAAAKMLAIPETVEWREGQQFYWRVPDGGNTQKFFVRTGLDGDERMIFDPVTQSPGADRGLSVYVPNALKSSVSPDGKYVVIPLSNGDENLELVVVDAQAGVVLDDSLQRVRHGSITWLDDSTFVYSRGMPRRLDRPRTEYYAEKQLYRHVVGTDMRDDVPVFGNGLQADTNGGRYNNLEIKLIGDRAFGSSRFGVARELDVFVASKEELSRGVPSWKKIIDSSRGVVAFDKCGDDWVMMVCGSRQRERKVLRAQGGDEPNWDTATLAVPETGQDITGIHVKDGVLYVTRMVNAMTEELLRVPQDDAQIAAVFSIDGKISSVSSLPVALGGSAKDGSGHAGLLIEAIPWTSGLSQSCRLTYDGGKTELSALSATPDFSSDIATELRYASNPGGRPVPVILVHRKDLDRGEPHVAKLISYGGYEVRTQPDFLHHALDSHALAGQRNVVLAYADVWDGAADEVNAAARMLIEEGYTTVSQLTRSGRSRGGATVGLAATHAPELSARLLLEHGMVDTIGHEFTPNGPGNIPEFGSVATPQGLQQKLKIDVYRNLPAVDFPEKVMVTTGHLDIRVEAAASGKLVAALQYANDRAGRTRDILLRSDPGVGHFQRTVEQIATYATDIGLFVLDAIER